MIIRIIPKKPRRDLISITPNKRNAVWWLKSNLINASRRDATWMSRTNADNHFIKFSCHEKILINDNDCNCSSVHIMHRKTMP